MDIKTLILKEDWNAVNNAIASGSITMDDCVDAVIGIGEYWLLSRFARGVENLSGANILKLVKKEIELSRYPLGEKIVNYAKLPKAPIDELEKLAMYDDSIHASKDEKARSTVFFARYIKTNDAIINFIIERGRAFDIVWLAQRGEHNTPEIIKKLAESIIKRGDIKYIYEFAVKVSNPPFKILINGIAKMTSPGYKICQLAKAIAESEKEIKLPQEVIDNMIDAIIETQDDKHILELAIRLQDISDASVDRVAAINKLIKSLNSNIEYFGQNVRECGSIEKLADRIYNSGNVEGIVHFAIDFDLKDVRFDPININNTFFKEKKGKDISDIVIPDFKLDAKYNGGYFNMNHHQTNRATKFILGTNDMKCVYKLAKETWSDLTLIGWQQVIDFIIKTNNASYLYLCSRVISHLNDELALSYVKAMINLKDPISMACLLLMGGHAIIGNKYKEQPARVLLAKTLQTEYNMAEWSLYCLDDPYPEFERQLLEYGGDWFENEYGGDHYGRLSGNKSSEESFTM